MPIEWAGSVRGVVRSIGQGPRDPRWTKYVLRVAKELWLRCGLASPETRGRMRRSNTVIGALRGLRLRRSLMRALFGDQRRIQNPTDGSILGFHLDSSAPALRSITVHRFQPRWLGMARDGWG